MKKLLVGLVTMLFLAGMVGVVGADTLTFEDSPGTPIYDGYGGFNWNTTGVNIGATIYSSGTSGYHYLDPDGYVAYNWNGDDPTAIAWAGTGTFDFNSADWRSAWDTSQTLTLKGYLGGTELYSTNFTIYRYQETTHSALNWTGIDTLEIWSSGSHYALDNFTFNENAPVPEPATMLLFGTGLAGLAGLRRRQGKK